MPDIDGFISVQAVTDGAFEGLIWLTSLFPCFHVCMELLHFGALNKM